MEPFQNATVGYGSVPRLVKMTVKIDIFFSSVTICNQNQRYRSIAPMATSNSSNSMGISHALTPLHRAASKGYTARVELLLEQGAEVSAKNHAEETPLHQAAGFGRHAVALVLLEHNADVWAKDITGRTPLHWASTQDVAGLLLEYGAEVSGQDNCGRSPLHWAVLYGCEDVVGLLLKHGADLSAKDYAGRTPWDVATEHSQPLIVAMIKAVAGRRALAFAMGQHARLGEGSRVWELDGGVVQILLELV